MKLHYHPLSSYSLKALTALFEKEAVFTPFVVDLFSPGAVAEHRKTYPLGKVPMLVLDDGEALGESTSIIEYVDARVSTGTRLVPEDPELARRVRHLTRLFDHHVNDLYARIYHHGARPEAERNPKELAAIHAELDRSYPYLDALMAGRTWALGDTFSMADCAAAAALWFAMQRYSFEQHRHLVAYLERLCARPSFARAKGECERFVAGLRQA